MSDQRKLLLTPASQIPVRRQKWLWQDRVPLGTATIFAGRGGEGKSTFALYLSALAIRGELDGDLKGRGTNVLIVSHEDDWSTVMNPRLIGAGADLSAVFKLSIASTVDEITAETIPALPLDLNLIRQAVAETGARVIIFDPITSTIGGDLYKVADVRRALDPLAALAQELDLAVICIMHLTKGAGNASDKLSGSHAFRDVVRSLLLFATDDETGQRVVTVDKSNYSQERGSSFAFNLVSADVPTEDGTSASVGAVQYLGDTDLTVSDIINRTPAEEGDGDDAESWLRSFMLDNAGSAPAKQIMNAAISDGFAKATIQRVGKKLCDKSSSGFQGSWTWTLRQGSRQDSHGSHLPKDENHENDGENYGSRRAVEKVAESVGPQGGYSFDAFVTPSTPREPDDPEEAQMIAYSDLRPAIAKRAGLTCPVCGDVSRTGHHGYCDRTDTAHANHRADAAAGVLT